MAKQRNSLGMIVLDASFSIFGTADPISFEEYKKRTGVDLNDIISNNGALKSCSKLVLSTFNTGGGEVVLTPISLGADDDSNLLINSSYDGGSGDYIASRLVISVADKTVAWGEI